MIGRFRSMECPAIALAAQFDAIAGIKQATVLGRVFFANSKDLIMQTEDSVRLRGTGVIVLYVDWPARRLENGTPIVLEIRGKVGHCLSDASATWTYIQVTGYKFHLAYSRGGR